jgi:hypothetical protein
MFVRPQQLEALICHTAYVGDLNMKTESYEGGAVVPT